MGYDAATDCTDADAWTCLARTVEEAGYQRGGGAPRPDRKGRKGGGGGGGGIDENDRGSDERVEAEPLELTVMRCVRAFDRHRCAHVYAAVQQYSEILAFLRGDERANTSKCAHGVWRPLEPSRGTPECVRPRYLCLFPFTPRGCFCWRFARQRFKACAAGVSSFRILLTIVPRPHSPFPLPPTPHPNSRTRLVEVLHDEKRQAHLNRSRKAARRKGRSYSAAEEPPLDPVTVYRCAGGQVVTVDSGGGGGGVRNDDRGRLLLPAGDELSGCDSPRVVGEGGLGLVAAPWGGRYGVGFGEGAASVSDTSTGAVKELWRVWPEVVASGMNRFREEVEVTTSLGPAATPLAVSVAVTVPRLVVGVARMSAVCPLASDAACPYSLEDGTDEVMTPALLAAAAKDHKARMTGGGGGGSGAVLGIKGSAGGGGGGGDTTGSSSSGSGSGSSSTTKKHEHQGGGREDSGTASRGGGGSLPVVRFPLTQVGEERDVYVEIRNPADVPVGVQLSAGQGESLVWTEAGRDGQAAATVVAVGVDVADLGTKVGAAGKAGGRAESAQQLELVRDGSFAAGALAAFHIRMGAFLPVILPPGGRAVVGPLRFTPAKEGVFSANVFLRNNLTHIEPVRLEGEAGAGVLSVRPWGEEPRSAAAAVGVVGGVGEAPVAPPQAAAAAVGGGRGARWGWPPRRGSCSATRQTKRTRRAMRSGDSRSSRASRGFRWTSGRGRGLRRRPTRW